MRLLIAADIFPPQAGGPATYAVTLANELVKQSEEVTIVSLNPQADKNVLDKKVKFYRVRATNRRVRYFEFFWLLWLHAFKNDVIYAMGPVNAGWPAMWANRLQFKKKKFVVKVVGDYAWEQGVIRSGVKESIDDFQNKQYTKFVGRLQAAERQVVKAADLVITPSYYLKSMVMGWGVNEKKIEVIYNAVEFKDVPPAPKPPGEKWIVSVGRLVPWKGMQMLVEVMPDILKLVPEAKLKIVGGGPEEKNLKFKIKDLRLENQVELLGYKTHDETLSYLHAADVFVLNSGYEGLSHVILEALSLGRPVIASKSGGNTEVGIAPENLFVYNDREIIKNKIIHHLRNSGFNKGVVFADNRKEFFDQFKLETMVEKTKEILTNLCNPQ